MKKQAWFITLIAIGFSLFYILFGRDLLMQKAFNKYTYFFEKIDRFEQYPYNNLFNTYDASLYDSTQLKYLTEADTYIANEFGFFPILFLISLVVSLIGILYLGPKAFYDTIYIRIILIVAVVLALAGIITDYSKFRIIVTILLGILLFFRYRYANNNIKDFYALIYLCFFIVYNPIFPIYLDKNIWTFINIFTIAIVVFEKLSQDNALNMHKQKLLD